MRASVIVILLGGLLLARPMSALAQPAADVDSPTRELAKRHFQTGNTYYSVANYKEALSEFEKAYKLLALPGMLFNIGRCHENLGNLKAAIESYRRYLREHKETPEPTVKLRIENLEKRLAEQQPQTPPPDKTPASTAVPEQVPVAPPRAPADERSGPRWKRPAGWATLGVGVVSLVTGIAFGAMVRSKSQEYEDGAKVKTYTELQDIRSSGESYQKIEIATLVVGGVLVAAGSGLLIWDALDRKRGRESTALRVLPVVSGQGFGLVTCKRF